MTTFVRRRATRIDVYTDGACSGSPGPGGWAWAVDKGTWAAGNDPSTTNQRMEIKAVLEACVQLLSEQPNQPLCIVTDSAYVMNCFTQGWHKSWTKKGKKRNGEPVANWDLWEVLIPWVLHHDVTWRKVKGHSGDKGNDFVDEKAVEAKKRLM